MQNLFQKFQILSDKNFFGQRDPPLRRRCLSVRKHKKPPRHSHGRDGKKEFY